MKEKNFKEWNLVVVQEDVDDLQRQHLANLLLDHPQLLETTIMINIMLFLQLLAGQWAWTMKNYCQVCDKYYNYYLGLGHARLLQ